MKEKVIVGLSGGVDSAVAIIKLLEAGYDVEAMFMRNWDAWTNHDILGNPTIGDSLCPQEIDYQDAIKVADKLGVKLHRIDFVDQYWNDVFLYFLSEYEKAEHPIRIFYATNTSSLRRSSSMLCPWELITSRWVIMPG